MFISINRRKRNRIVPSISHGTDENKDVRKIYNTPWVKTRFTPRAETLMFVSVSLAGEPKESSTEEVVNLAPISEHYKALLYAVAEDFRSLLQPDNKEDAKVVQKGLILYRQGLVTNVRLEEDLVMGVVHDVVHVEVELDLNFPAMNSCTCPASKPCRHQLAVFFQIYSKIDSVTDWIDNWRNPQPVQKKDLAESLGLKTAKDLLKNKPATMFDYNSWLGTITDNFRSHIEGTPPYLLNELYEVYARKIKASAPFRREWKTLYFLTASLHTFLLLLRLAAGKGLNDDKIDQYYGHIFPGIVAQIDEQADTIGQYATPFAFDPIIERLKEDTFQLLDDNLGMREKRIRAYTALWSKLFNKEQWREEELAKITDGPAHKSSSPGNAAVYHWIMLGDDDRALKMLKQLGTDGIPHLPERFTYLAKRREWKRIGPFADFFAANFENYIHSIRDGFTRGRFIQKALAALEPYISAMKKFHLYEKLLTHGLPDTYWQYEDYLYRMEQYEKWADLVIYRGFSVYSLSGDRLKFLEREHPEMLLPIYHQSIERHLAAKNRADYREAVRELKKLRTLYRTLKRQNDWEQYFQLLLEKTKRMRAFIEECERGRLIHA